jgi:transcriptional regulator with XRE-family HTH domain
VQYLRDNTFLTNFGVRLRKLRKQRGFTQETLANEVGVEISQISRIERGILNTSISLANTISKALDIPIKDLFDF